MSTTMKSSTVTSGEDENNSLLQLTSSSASSTPKCVLDGAVLNEDTVSSLKDMGLSIFAVACGKNRGAFVLEKPDGNTYSW